MNSEKEISEKQLQEIWQRIKDSKNQQEAMKNILLSEFSDYSVFVTESVSNGEILDCNGAFFKIDYANAKAEYIKQVCKDYYDYLTVNVVTHKINWLFNSSSVYEQPFYPNQLLEN